MAYLAVDGDRRIYFEHHEGAKRPVVLVHGWGMSCRVWDTTLPRLLENGNTVVSIDHRACGSSDKDFSDTSIGAIAGDVVALVRHLGLQSPVLNGWSIGGPVVVEAGSRLGADLGAIVLTCGATPRYAQADDFPHGGPADAVGATVGALRADRVNFLNGLSQGVCAEPQPDAMIAWMTGIFLQASPQADATLAELGVLDQRAILAGITAPVLSMVGAKDVIVDPEIGRLAARSAPNGRLVEFPGCGHAPFLEDGPRYRDELVSFVNSL